MVNLQSSSSSGLQVREDLAQKYADLFGDKSVNGRTVKVEELIAKFTNEFSEDFRRIAKMRHEFLSRQRDVREKYAFLSPDQEISDADGNKATVGQIRQGMLDNFFGKESPYRWKLNERIPIPDEVTRTGLQGTGPFDDLGMAMSALNVRTASWMPDWEDAGNDYQDKLYRAWQNLKELLAGKWEGRTYLHPRKKKEYKIGVPRESWPVLFIRVPGLHLRNRQMTLDGKPVPATIPALVLYALNNYDSQHRHKSGIYYYVPKIETSEEALLFARLLKALEEAIGVPRGTIKIEMLNE
ncbi:MAG: malate synthase, partial [Acidobacteriota bacterium]